MEKIAHQILAAIELLTEALPDAEKFDKGVSGAPGTRVRKTSTDLAARMKSLRLDINEVRAARKAETA